MRPLCHLLLPLASIAALVCAGGNAFAEEHHHSHSDKPCKEGHDDDGDEQEGEQEDDEPGGSSMDVTVQAKPNGVVDVNQFGGNVHVKAWSQSAIHVRGQFNSECHVNVGPSGERREVRVSCSHGPSTGDLEVEIPRGSSLEVRTMSADVTTEGVSGAVHVQTVTGDIEVKGGAPPEIEARSTSGDIQVQAASPSTRAHSVSGDVRIAGVRGHATIQTVSGDCTLSGGDFTSVVFQSVSGDLGFRGAMVGPERFEIESHSGDIALHLPPTTAADVEMRSMSGDLVIDMGSGKKTAEREMDARIGAGGSMIRLRTYSGDIVITQ